jgi:hypothetical protein
MEARMKMGFWSSRRFGQLMLREIVGGYRSLLIAVAAVGGALLILSALTLIGMVQTGNTQGGQGGFYLSYFIQFLFIGGFVVTSLSFREARQGAAGIFYLTLPGSLFEKLLGKLLVTSVGYAAGTLIVTTAVAALSEGVNQLIFGFGHGFFNPFTGPVLYAVALYLVTQSIFLLGSVWFKKVPFLKTVMWLAILAVVAAIVSVIAVRVLLVDHLSWGTARTGFFQSWSLNLNNGYVASRFAPGTRGESGLMAFKLIGQICLWGLLAPVCWVAAYFRLGEIEV